MTCCFCVAGVALGGIDVHFVWRAWRLQHLARLVPAGAGHFAWQAWQLVISTLTWHLLHLAGSGGALRSAGTGPLFLAGIALGDIVGDIHAQFVWQAWHLLRLAAAFGAPQSAPGHFAWQA